MRIDTPFLQSQTAQMEKLDFL